MGTIEPDTLAVLVGFDDSLDLNGRIVSVVWPSRDPDDPFNVWYLVEAHWLREQHPYTDHVVRQQNLQPLCPAVLLAGVADSDEAQAGAT